MRKNHEKQLYLYLKGELSIKEISSLEKALKADNNLRRELEDLKLFLQSTADAFKCCSAKNRALRSLPDFPEHETPRISTGFKRAVYISVGAVIMFLMVFLIIWPFEKMPSLKSLDKDAMISNYGQRHLQIPDKPEASIPVFTDNRKPTGIALNTHIFTARLPRVEKILLVSEDNRPNIIIIPN